MRRGLLGMAKHGSRAVDEKQAEVGVTSPSGMTKPSSRSRPRSVFTWAVRAAIQPERNRWIDPRTCCAIDFTGTGRISALR